LSVLLSLKKWSRWREEHKEMMSRQVAKRGARVAVRWTTAMAEATAVMAIAYPQLANSAEWTANLAEETRTAALKAKLISEESTASSANNLEQLVASSTAMAVFWAIYLEVFEAGISGGWAEALVKAFSVAIRVQAEELATTEGFVVLDGEPEWGPAAWAAAAAVWDNFATTLTTLSQNSMELPPMPMDSPPLLSAKKSPDVISLPIAMLISFFAGSGVILAIFGFRHGASSISKEPLLDASSCEVVGWMVGWSDDKL
jgi:hypothetical protein